MPNTRRDFWEQKFNGNQEHHRKARKELKKMGWRVMVVWESQIWGSEVLLERLTKFTAGK
jgi:DNA mismatch endonuclease (patch repair protein)